VLDFGDFTGVLAIFALSCRRLFFTYKHCNIGENFCQELVGCVCETKRNQHSNVRKFLTFLQISKNFQKPLHPKNKYATINPVTKNKN